MRQLTDTTEKGDADRIRLRVEDLDAISKPFAGRRMDRSIKNALSGQKLESFEEETADARGIESHLEKGGRR